jgi:K+-sensing histidine kinase KdpD
METQFAPAERSAREEILKQQRKLDDSGIILAVSESTNTYFMILNSFRQLIYANQELLDLVSSTSDEVIGLRPGEILNCINSVKTEGGCGTHEFCRECGAVQAILEALQGIPCTKECRITAKKNGDYISYDLSVKAVPVNKDEINGVLVSVIDISDSKRRKILERTFFHDILNSVSGLYGASYLLLNKDIKEGKNLEERASTIYEIVNSIVDEIKSQQMLLTAENGDLKIHTKDIELSELMHEVGSTVSHNLKLMKCGIDYSFNRDIMFRTDPALLKRVLVNMIKNAAEECRTGETVKVTAEVSDHSLRFSVHNDKVIEDEIKHQIFQRSFSTKGLDRGIGTYSMKLFGENYLKGRIWFESEEGKGTTFYFEMRYNSK